MLKGVSSKEVVKLGYYKSPPSRPKTRWLIPLLIGVAIGVFIVAEVIPSFLDSKFVSNGQNDENNSVVLNDEANDSNTSNEASTLSHVTVDITTQITDIVSEVSPTVVGVTNIRTSSDFWQQQEASEAGTGSGVIYKKDNEYAYIVTNFHVIEGADEVEVVLYDDTHIEAELLGGDLFSDLAVLRMPGDTVDKAIEMGTAENLKVGEPVIAIGNPLGHMFAGSVTQGIISGTQRTIPQDFNYDGRADWQAEVIQTDAAINPGNSGGALINMEGQLIGINSMKVNQEAVEGIGFSIPIDSARPIMNELETTGIVTRPFIGVEIYSLDEVPQTEWESTLGLPRSVEGGVYVWSVEPFSPADKAGIERLDVITHLDDREIMNMIDLRKILYQEKEVDDEIKITYYRDGEKLETTLTLGQQQ